MGRIVPAHGVARLVGRMGCGSTAGEEAGLVKPPLVGAGIAPGDFSRRYPLLYHVAADNSWQSISRHGLLSTSALLDLFEYTGRVREAIEGQRRPEYVEVKHPIHGRAWIRDQKPLDDAGLARCLEAGTTPREWYLLLNRRVFFWPTVPRLLRMLTARAYRDQIHTVLTLDSRLLLNRHVDEITLSAINSGATKPMPHPRSPQTFQPLRTFPFHERLGRGLDPVAELAVDRSVPEVPTMVTTVRRMRRDEVIEVLVP
jgi:hypothetical protein